MLTRASIVCRPDAGEKTHEKSHNSRTYTIERCSALHPNVATSHACATRAIRDRTGSVLMLEHLATSARAAGRREDFDGSSRSPATLGHSFLTECVRVDKEGTRIPPRWTSMMLERHVMLERARRVRIAPVTGMSVLLNNISDDVKGAIIMSPRPATLFAAACLLAAAPTLGFAQVNTSAPSGTSVPVATAGTALIQWDLSSLPDALNGNPGAMVVDTRGEDNNRAWFVTRVAAPDDTAGGEHVYRLDPARSLMKGNAYWTSWDLRFDAFAGGLKKMRMSHDRRYIFGPDGELHSAHRHPELTGSAPTCSAPCGRSTRGHSTTRLLQILPSTIRTTCLQPASDTQFPKGYVQMLIPDWRREALELNSAPTACPRRVRVAAPASPASPASTSTRSRASRTSSISEQGTDTIAELNIDVTTRHRAPEHPPLVARKPSAAPAKRIPSRACSRIATGQDLD